MRDEARKKARDRAKELVEKMTIDEVISQLSYNAPAIERHYISTGNRYGGYME